MNDVFLVRLFAFSILPLLLALGHMVLDKQSRTSARRIELIVMYVLAISVGANGISSGYGHLFLSDLVAEGIGWPAGSPFQLEIGFANLALGVLGLMAIGRKGDFRTATIIVLTIFGVGATIVHLIDIAAHGNLAPGNTIQNFSNLLDPILLIVLTWWTARKATSSADSAAFDQWQARQRPVAGNAAVGIWIGFGVGFVMTNVLLWTVGGALVGAGLGVLIAQRATKATLRSR